MQFQCQITNKNKQIGSAKLMQNFNPVQQIHANQLCSKKLMCRSHMFPTNATSRSHLIKVGSSMQEYELLSNLVWRSNTPMPIVKVTGFRHGTTTYPKVYLVEIEAVATSVKELEGIGLQGSLYLIQECLSGVQALAFKYHELDFHGIFYGVTEAGNCKVWISQNLTEYKSMQLPLPSEDIIITSIIRMIQAVSDPSAKCKLNQLYNSTANIHNIKYYEFQVNLSLFAKKNKIQIPTFLQVNQQIQLISLTKRQIARRANSLQPSYTESTEIGKQVPWQRAIKPSPERNKEEDRYYIYENMNESRLSDRLTGQTRNNSLLKRKSIESMLSSPNKLREKLKISKDLANVRVIRTTSIKNTPSQLFQSEHKSEKTRTSFTIHSENFLTPHIAMRTQSEYGINSNRESLIISQTNLSQRFDNSVLVEKEQKTHSKKSDMQGKIDPGNYNFGGLLALHMPQKSIKQSQEIDESGLSGIHRFYQKMTHRQTQHKSSLVLNNDERNIMGAWDWQIKMTKLLTQDTNNLKQSVYCGEEKKPEPLPIKLQKLGRLGRQITSIIPEGHQN